MVIVKVMDVFRVRVRVRVYLKQYCSAAKQL